MSCKFPQCPILDVGFIRSSWATSFTAIFPHLVSTGNQRKPKKLLRDKKSDKGRLALLEHVQQRLIRVILVASVLFTPKWKTVGGIQEDITCYVKALSPKNSLTRETDATRIIPTA